MSSPFREFFTAAEFDALLSRYVPELVGPLQGFRTGFDDSDEFEEDPATRRDFYHVELALVLHVLPEFIETAIQDSDDDKLDRVAAFLNEWDRLTRGYVSWEVTCVYLKDNITPPPILGRLNPAFQATIADIFG
jgi:hypothetical protein